MGLEGEAKSRFTRLEAELAELYSRFSNNVLDSYSGNAVVIDHGTGIFTIYAHLSRIDVAAGQPIEKGQRLGLTGATGRVSGPHLHWGVKINGIAVNPMQLIKVIASLLPAQR